MKNKKSVKRKKEKMKLMNNNSRVFFVLIFVFGFIFLVGSVSGAGCPDVSGTWIVSSNTVINESNNSGNIVCDEITINSGVTLTVNTTNMDSSFNFTATNITVLGIISADYAGNAISTGTGQGQDGSDDNGAGGGSHGGDAGNGETGKTGGTHYGNVLTPTTAGSGGGACGIANCNSKGGRGGGIIFINVTDTFNLTGIITVDGEEGIGAGWDFAGGGGAGGSVWIDSGTLTGSGSIGANGGNGATWSSDGAGGGAGGRVAVYYNTNNGFSTTSSTVTGGSGGTGAQNGDVGTLAFIDKVNNNIYIDEGFEIQANLNYSNITMNNALVRMNGTYDFNATNMASTGTNYWTCYDSSDTILINIGGTAIFNGFTFCNCSSFNATGANLTIASDSIINLDYLGYAITAGTGQGQDGSDDNGAGGGSHGGDAGNGETGKTGGTHYGNVLTPTTAGSGGGNCGTANCNSKGGKGGGTIFINATGTFNLTGTITVDGEAGAALCCDYAGGGGAGGSVWIDTDVLIGSGSIGAVGGVGGDRPSADGGGGAGGRIAVYFNGFNTTSYGLINIVTGGTGPGDAIDGGTGSFIRGAIYSNFTQARTTDFNSQANITGILNPSLGDANVQIKFFGTVNASSADFDANVISGRDSIFVNSSALDSSFNVSANITFYDLTFGAAANTIIKKDGVNCSECRILEYSGNILVINVTGFSEYTVEAVDETAPNVSLNAPEEGYNTSSTTIVFNFTAIEDMSANLNCSLMIDSVFYDENATTQNNTLTSLTATGLTNGTHEWNVTCLDASLNSNTTASRNFYIDTTAPNSSGLFYAPSVAGDVDPFEEISFNVNISDNWIGVDTVILQYNDGTNWANETMVVLASGTYQANITLIGVNATYTYNVWANDSFGNFNTTTNATFVSAWDCTWVATSDLGAIAGFNVNKFIGNITLNNTGDASYAVSNCSLDFRLTHNFDEGRVYFDNDYIKPSSIYTIAAGGSSIIEVNATYLITVKEEGVNITINEIRSRSQTYERNTTATLVTLQEGPYLYKKVSSYPTSVYLTSGNFSLESYVRNLMGSTTFNENNTAYNVSIAWVLPAGTTNVSGNLSQIIVNVSENNLNYDNIDVGFEDLESMSNGVQNITLAVSGVNLSGDLISHAGSVTNLTETIQINFLCYNISDGVIVTSCGSLDGDYVAPTTPAETTGTTGGSGGGGGGADRPSKEILQNNEDFQLIRGEQNKIIIPFTNKDSNKSITSIDITLKGEISKYMTVNPRFLYELKAGESIDLVLEITSPTYVEIGRHEFELIILGKKGSISYIETKKVVLEIHKISTEKAKELLIESDDLITQLDEAGLSLDYLSNLLTDSNNAIGNFDYEIILDNYNIISQQVGFALDAKQILFDLENSIADAEKKGISISATEKLFKLAQLSLDRREFEVAYSRAKEAQSTFAFEVKGELGKISYYLKNYPGEISLAVVLLFILGFGGYKTGRHHYLKNKIKSLKKEQEIIYGLMKTVQIDCFDKKKMSMDEYKTAMDAYQAQLSKIIEKIIEAENKRVHNLKFTSEDKRLKKERSQIIELIKNLQANYLEKRNIEQRGYDIGMESYNQRLGEVEHRLAVLEAKKEFKQKKKSFFRIFKKKKPLLDKKIRSIKRK